MGHVYSGVTTQHTLCCFCGHEHRDALWIALSTRDCTLCTEAGAVDAHCHLCGGTNIIQAYPWWCGRKLGIHRGPQVEVVRG